MIGHLSIKASCHKLHEVLSRLNGLVRDLFSTTSFGYLLDLTAQSRDELLIHGLLLHMLRPTAETDADERLYFRFSRRTLSFEPEEFCLVIGLYMGRCPNSMIEFSTMYKHRYGENTFQSRVFPYRTDTSLVVEDLELLILNQRFNAISAQDGVRAIFLYIPNQDMDMGDVSSNPGKWGMRMWYIVHKNQIEFNEDDHVGNSPEDDSRKQIVKKKKKKKEVVASDIVDAKNHILRPVVKEGRPVKQLKPSQYLSSPYVSVQNATPISYRWGNTQRNNRSPYLTAIPQHF
ncbi:unnamed protein product [Lactuca saligna]|uniref:Uncharacterized protein n=1 Tax=Lactuca saligna TaxID=75948 RepID=A0AA35V8G9_LACSI|nr:unnamed protein product [Lactuca saligna]